jgi:hypothetical protein
MKRSLILSCILVAAIAAFSTDLCAQVKAIAPASQLNNIEELVDRYFISLNDPDDRRRRDLIKQVWAEKGKFGVVPLIEGDGLAAIDEVTKGGMTKFPGATVRRTSKIDGAGNYYRWNFTVSQADGKPIASGVDFAVIIDGKLQSVIGFID